MAKVEFTFDPQPMPGYCPGFWMNETSGTLVPAVWRYIEGKDLSPAEVSLMQKYLEMWISATGWVQTPLLAALRSSVRLIGTRREIAEWLDQAMDEGIDPL